MPKTIDPLAMAKLFEDAARALRFVGEMPQEFIEAHLGPYTQDEPRPALLPQPERPALPRRSAAQPPTSDPKTTAVRMRLDGAQAHEIAEATGLSIHMVYGAISDARKAGVKFPSTPRSPNGSKSKGGVFAISVEELSDGIHRVAKAAEGRGIDVQTYMDRRKTAIEMAMAGRHIRAIMEATRESKATLTGWFSAARSAGYAIPYMLDAGIGHAENRNVVDLGKAREKRVERRTFPTSVAEVTGKGRRRVVQAAEDMGITLAAYMDLRARALSLYQGHKTPSEVASLLKISQKQAENWRRRAWQAGKLAAFG